MIASIPDQIVAMHKQWSDLDARTKPKAFWRFVARNDRGLFNKIYRDPTPLRSLSRQMQADWKGEYLEGISPRVLQKHIAELTRRYLAGGHDAPSLEVFVNGIVAQCDCEEDLKDLLAKTS